MPSTPIPTFIYHMTAISNLPKILDFKALYSKNELNKQSITPSNIAYEDLRDRREKTIVTCTPLGNLNDYVPFYFAPRSPMLSAVVNGKVQNSCSQSEICYLISTAQHIHNQKLKYVFYPGHPIMQLSHPPYNNINDLTHIDWEIFFEDPKMGGYAKYFHDNDNPQKPKWADRKRLRQAEFLVHLKLAWEDVLSIAVFSEEKKEEVSGILSAKNSTIKNLLVNTTWYF